MNKRTAIPISVYFENLGCAKNQVDAEVMACRLEEKGCTVTDKPEEADIIVVNTCAFIESAREESVNTFFSLKKACPKAKMVVAGCLAQRYASELGKLLPETSAVFGNRDLSLIDSVVKQVSETEAGSEPLVSVPPYPDPDSEISARKHLFGYPGSAYVKISEGCNHNCAYCAIPLIRGSLRSRAEESIVSEVKTLVAGGIKEINLVAQDLAAYGSEKDGKSRFPSLLKALNALEGDFAIRLLYIHPDMLTDEILAAVASCSKVLHYFDIPFQHASGRLLSAMGRKGNAQSYASLIDKVRSLIPDAAIRTTIMLGFPGDTDEDFSVVADFVSRCRFTWLGSFVYSLEEGTPAFVRTTYKEHKVLKKVAEKKQKELEKIQQIITAQELKKFVGNTYKVLIEEVFKDSDLAVGRIYAQAPEVDGLTVVSGPDMEAGEVYYCTVTGVNGFDLEAVKNE